MKKILATVLVLAGLAAAAGGLNGFPYGFPVYQTNTQIITAACASGTGFNCDSTGTGVLVRNTALATYLPKANFKDSANTRLLYPTGAAQGLGVGNSPAFAGMTSSGAVLIGGASLGGSLFGVRAAPNKNFLVRNAVDVGGDTNGVAFDFLNNANGAVIPLTIRADNLYLNPGGQHVSVYSATDLGFNFGVGGTFGLNGSFTWAGGGSTTGTLCFNGTTKAVTITAGVCGL